MRYPRPERAPERRGALRQITARPCPPEAERLLEQMGVKPGGRQLVLVTAHRRENFGQGLENICLALRDLAQAYPDRLALLYAVWAVGGGAAALALAALIAGVLFGNLLLPPRRNL